MVNFQKRTEMRVKYLERDLQACKKALSLIHPDQNKQ